MITRSRRSRFRSKDPERVEAERFVGTEKPIETEAPVGMELAAEAEQPAELEVAFEAKADIQPDHTLRLFLSLPPYAEVERRRLGATIAHVNTSLNGTLRIEPVWAGGSAGGGAPGAADCDAVIAVLRPRFPTDVPDSAEQGYAGSRGGAAGLVSAMGGGKDGAGLPDIYIFRYAESAEHAANDADWQAGKRAFDAWFKARGGKVLAFDDFYSSDAFGQRLNERLRFWLADLGYDLPEPVAEIEAGTPASDATLLPEEPIEPVAVTDAPDEALAQDVAETVAAELKADADLVEVEEALEGQAEAEQDVEPAPPKFEPAADAMSELAAEILDETPVLEVPETVSVEPEGAGEPLELFSEPGVESAGESTGDESASEPLAEAPGEAPAEPETVPKPEAALEMGEAEASPEETLDAPADPALFEPAMRADDSSESTEPVELIEVEPETGETEEPSPEADVESAIIVDALDSALEIDEEPVGDAGAAEEAVEDTVPAEPDAEPHTDRDAAPVVDDTEASTSEIALDSALEIEVAAPEEMPSAEAEEQVSDTPQTGDTASFDSERYDRLAQSLSATVIPLRPTRPQVEMPPPPIRGGNRAGLVVLAGVASASLVLAAVLGVQWRGAASRDKQIQQSLAAGSSAASNLVFELTDESRRLGGATSDGSKAILDEARKLQGALVIAGPFDPEALMADGDAAMTSSEALFKQGKLPEALKDAIRGQRLFQTLYSTDPEKPGWAKRLAASNLKIGDVLVSQNNMIEALGAYRDSLTLQKAIALKDPDSAEQQRVLSVAQQKIGDVLVVKGRLDEGLAIYRDATVIRKTLAQSDAGNADRQRDLLEIDNKVADVLSAQSHLDDSLVIYREALAIASRMALMNPAEPRWRAAMTLTNNKIGDVLVGKERIDDGLAAYREGLATIKDVAANDPRNSEWQSMIATTHERIGDAFVAESHFESALSSYRDALAVVQALVTKEPANTAWRRGLSETHLRIGSVYFNQNNLDGALAAHRDSLAIVKALATEDPNNSRWQHDVMIDNNDIGLLLTSKGSRGDALPYYREAQTIATAMSTKEPTDPSWQSTRGMIDNNIGAVLMDQGNRDDAIAIYRDGLSVAKALVARDPRSAEWQTSLVVALYNLGAAGDDAQANFTQAKDLLQRLDQAGVLRPDKRALIAKVDDALAKLNSGKPLPTGRRESSRRTAKR